MPPFALISSAAICAPPGVAAPAIDCTSAMTPILIRSADCAWAAALRKIATAPASRGIAPDGCICSLPFAFLVRCLFSLRRGKRSAVSKSMLAVWKLKAPEIAFAACRGPWDDRLIFPDPDKPDPPFAEGRAGPRQCAGDGHEEELSARTCCGVSFQCLLTLVKPTSNIPRLDVCLCPQRTRRIESFHGKRCN